MKAGRFQALTLPIRYHRSRRGSLPQAWHLDLLLLSARSMRRRAPERPGQDAAKIQPYKTSDIVLDRKETLTSTNILLGIFCSSKSLEAPLYSTSIENGLASIKRRLHSRAPELLEKQNYP